MAAHAVTATLSRNDSVCGPSLGRRDDCRSVRGANLEVEATEVDGHGVELVACPGVVGRPEVVPQLLCIPLPKLLQVSCPHLHGVNVT